MEQRALVAERMLEEEKAFREEAERQVRELKMKVTTTTTVTPGRGKKRKRESGMERYEEQEEERPCRLGNSGQGRLKRPPRFMKCADAQDHPLGLFQHLLQHSAQSSGGSHTLMNGGARYSSPRLDLSRDKRRPGVSDFARDFWLCEWIDLHNSGLLTTSFAQCHR